MKHLYREMALTTAAAILCVTLASGTAMAAEKSRTAAMRETAVQAISAEAVTANLAETRAAEDTEKAQAEKAAKDAWEKAEKQLKKVAEQAEKEAEAETRKKAEAAAEQKAVSETAENTVKENAEQAAKEVAELDALGLSASARIHVTAEELDLLAAIIYCEAGGEEMTGKVAVGAVVLNRVQSTAFENTIREVVYAPGQFTPAMTGLLDQVLAEGVNAECYAAARAALNGENPVGDCLYFNSGAGQGIQIGNQHFY